MDFKEVKSGERIVEIVNPKTGLPSGIKITIVAFGDERLKKIRRKILDDRLRLEARGKQFKAEDIEENQLLLTMQGITGWDWGIDPETGEPNKFGGEPPEYTPKNVREVLNALPWMHEQIQQEMSDEAAFF